MNIRTIIVDDEALAIAELKEMLRPHSIIEIIASPDRAEKAIEIIEKEKPDLLFLDVNMPGMNGFELLENLRYIPDVVFVTAYDHYAIRAFEVSALDYLVKPVNPKRLSESIERVQQRRAAMTADMPSRETIAMDSKIFVKDGETCHFIHLNEITYIENIGNYVRIHFGGHKTMMHRSLSYLESRLPEKGFFRANRREIFNLKQIAKIEPWFNSTLRVELKNGNFIEMSQRRSTRFREMMGL
jgi:two-component system LytT family response regulator